MYKIVMIMSICCFLLTSSVSYAGGPIFLDKIKNAFRETPTQTKQPRAKTVRPESTVRTSRRVPSEQRRYRARGSHDHIQQSRARTERLFRQARVHFNNLREENQRKLDRIHAVRNQTKLEDFAESDSEQLREKLSDQSTARDSKPRKVVIKKRNDTESRVPKPIFKDFR